MTLGKLLSFAAKYGAAAVAWARRNSWWLLPLGTKALQWIISRFG